MIFVDTNVFMYAVGRPHPLQSDARRFLETAARRRTNLLTSSEVMQELLHAYLPVQRLATLDKALNLVERSVGEVIALEAADVRLARQLYEEMPALDARDLCHLALCRRRSIEEIKTFDQALNATAKRFLG